MTETTRTGREGVDMGAATTRSLLGWGVVAGPFYLVFGLVLALTRPGFSLGRDALSLLLLGDLGWLQALNLVLAGLMTAAAAVGLLRMPRTHAPRALRAAAILVAVYALCLVLSAFFPPDPTGSFPPGVPGGTFSTAGLLHLVFGGIGFVALGVAAIVAGAWFAARGARGPAALSRAAGIVIIVAFAAGGALAQGPAGVILLWLAVLAGWAWLALISLAAYRAAPHPVSGSTPRR